MCPNWAFLRAFHAIATHPFPSGLLPLPIFSPNLNFSFPHFESRNNSFLIAICGLGTSLLSPDFDIGLDFGVQTALAALLQIPLIRRTKIHLQKAHTQILITIHLRLLRNSLMVTNPFHLLNDRPQTHLSLSQLQTFLPIRVHYVLTGITTLRRFTFMCTRVSEQSIVRL